MDARSLLLAGLLSALPPVVSAAVEPSDIEPPVLITHVDGTLVIDTDGRVMEYRPATLLPEPIGERVRDMVQAVRFVPVEQDGHVVRAETKVRVSIAATKLDDGGLRLALDNLAFPDGEAQKQATTQRSATREVPPTYPREALKWGAEADMLAAVHFDRNGDVTDVVMEQGAILHARVRPRDAATMLGLFETAALTSLRQWKVDPAQMTDDMRVDDGGFAAHIAVRWRLAPAEHRGPGPGATEDAKPGEWTMQTRSARRVPAWMSAAGDAPQPGVADLADGEVGAVNRRFRLASPLAPRGS